MISYPVHQNCVFFPQSPICHDHVGLVSWFSCLFTMNETPIVSHNKNGMAWLSYSHHFHHAILKSSDQTKLRLNLLETYQRQQGKHGILTMCKSGKHDLTLTSPSPDFIVTTDRNYAA